MNKKELYSKLYEMVDLLGADIILDELSMVMTSKDLENGLKYTDRMYDLRLFDDYDLRLFDDDEEN